MPSNAKTQNPMQYTADLCDHYPQAQVVHLPWQHFGGRKRFCGPVVTLKTQGDNLTLVEWLKNPGLGRVMLVDAAADGSCALMGGNMGVWAAENGWAGLVIYGYLRDVHELRQIPLGMMALGSNPKPPVKCQAAAVNIALEMNGTTIQPGDWLYADEDGVVILPAQLSHPLWQE